ncbi:MAG: redox-sensing transcriptional repressor Rex [Spirochaetes bacterium]|nr:redox-sensing transcriptional repressor Rex [Spirochaetota bacterium]
MKKATSSKISNFSIERLLLYSRTLSDIKRNQKVTKILSTDIASFLNIDSTQVRKDLSYIGKLGKRGLGYFVDSLLNALNSFLYRDKKINTAILGIGKLGSALLGYQPFQKYNIHIVAGFDVNPNKIGNRLNNIIIYPVDELEYIIKAKNIQIGVITTPESAAFGIAERLKNAGVKAIINFAPVFISFADKPIVENIDLSYFFEIARYKIFR